MTSFVRGQTMRVTRIQPAGWLVMAGALFLAAVAVYAWLIVAYFPNWVASDATVYRDAGIAVHTDPGQLYSLRLGVGRDPFIYPPFAALLFAAASWLPFTVWQVALTTATIVALPVVAYLALGIAGRPAGLTRQAGALAIAAAGLWLEPVASTLAFGQINMLLLALVVGDLALPDRFRGKGIGIGLAAAIKLTPLIFVAYLLFSRRVRAAVTGTLTFGATVALGFALLPAASAAFWHGQLTAYNRNGRLLNQSLNGTVLRLTHEGPQAHAYWLAAAIVVGVIGLGAAVLASRRGHELLGLVTCGATSLLVSPETWSHHYVYVVPALALACCGPRRAAYRAAGAAMIIALFGYWPMPIGGDGGFHPAAGWLPRGLLRLAPHYGTIGRATPEQHWRGLELIFGNYYVLTALVFVIAVAGAMLTQSLRARAAGPAAPAPLTEADRPAYANPVTASGEADLDVRDMPQHRWLLPLVVCNRWPGP
jgi:alpha-1,2-mannosyltransferase